MSRVVERGPYMERSPSNAASHGAWLLSSAERSRSGSSHHPVPQLLALACLLPLRSVCFLATEHHGYDGEEMRDRQGEVNYSDARLPEEVDQDETQEVTVAMDHPGSCLLLIAVRTDHSRGSGCVSSGHFEEGRTAGHIVQELDRGRDRGGSNAVRCSNCPVDSEHRACACVGHVYRYAFDDVCRFLPAALGMERGNAALQRLLDECGREEDDGHDPEVERQLLSERERWFPKVLVQIVMYNERECYKLSIGACARLDWPRDRLLVQVLDDSDEEEMKSLVHEEVERWVKEEGVKMVVNRRADISGFKGGNLKSGFEAPYTKEYEFIAVFDADFQPEPDFLACTIPFFRDDPKVALVQARWAFNNSYQNILTRTQLIDLSYHFAVEQQVQAATGLFFQFNGTAGVRRRSAIVDAGGWLTRTIVEDMDSSFRAFLRGWRFKYLDQVRVVSENPTSVRVYSRQQHRWSAGPARLLVLVFADILRCKHLSFSSKFHMLVMLMFFRKIVPAIVGTALAFLVLPLFALIPELVLTLPIALVAICLGAVVARILSGRQQSLLACLLIVAPYIWVASSVAVTRAIGCVQGLLDRPEASDWIVTEKTGVRGGHEECDDDEEDGEEAGGEVEGDKAVGGRGVG
ncbi:GT2-family glycosyltransferase [Chara braunii]|uniref:glucomannan 4-beta-mannosyltransferase n=1 Tax=Chara braunii TaxID=69332 RepID=A0A388KSS8_CHABU|nr:GT2-family glycosyltransferase [Chara braunii]|eukprot:GBG73110.1 GT2-family glycosyltransferase [Chara braunii]